MEFGRKTLLARRRRERQPGKRTQEPLRETAREGPKNLQRRKPSGEKVASSEKTEGREAEEKDEKEKEEEDEGEVQKEEGDGGQSTKRAS